MKSILIILLSTVSFSTAVAQCSISLCRSTGTWAAAFNDKTEYYSMQDLKEMSLNECRKIGGTNCRNYEEGYEEGWWAFIVGFDESDIVVAGSVGHYTKDDAVKRVRIIYKEKTGSFGYEYEVFSWYVYVNTE